ncbi:hypothetical protein ACWKWU_22695 [Chitinophaga lutea]
MTTARLYITLLLLFCAAGAAAQQKKPAAKTPAAKAAAPASAATQRPQGLRTSWHIYLSDSLPRPDVLKVLDSPLVVRDKKNVKYPVVSFDFTYEKKEGYLNDTTQQVQIAVDMTGDSFQSDRLAPLWSNRLKETLEKGDVLYFNNIVIRFAEDKFYRAPELKITIR